MYMYLVPLTYALKMVKIKIFILYTFYLSKKNIIFLNTPQKCVFQPKNQELLENLDLVNLFLFQEYQARMSFIL